MAGYVLRNYVDWLDTAKRNAPALTGLALTEYGALAGGRKITWNYLGRYALCGLFCDSILLFTMSKGEDFCLQFGCLTGCSSEDTQKLAMKSAWVTSLIIIFVSDSL